MTHSVLMGTLNPTHSLVRVSATINNQSVVLKWNQSLVNFKHVFAISVETSTNEMNKLAIK